jgi:hypothetical protein
MQLFFGITIAAGLLIQLLEWNAKWSSVAPSQFRSTSVGWLIAAVGAIGLVCVAT